MSPERLTLFDEFELKGYWWLPTEPNNQLFGSVSFRPESGISLELLGLFGGVARMAALATTMNESIVQGFSANGKNMTLLDSHTTSMQAHMPGIPSHTLSANYLFLGDTEFRTRQDIRFNSMMVSLTHFEHWLGINPFDVRIPVGLPREREVTATYQPQM